jgi:hypothetical protein
MPQLVFHSVRELEVKEREGERLVMNSGGTLTIVAFALVAALAWPGAALVQAAATPVPTDPWPRPIKLDTATGLRADPPVSPLCQILPKGGEGGFRLADGLIEQEWD